MTLVTEDNPQNREQETVPPTIPGLLDTLSRVTAAPQWLTLCGKGSVECCAGTGPLHHGETLDKPPVPLQPDAFREGWLATAPAGDDGDTARLLACWFPEGARTEQEALLELLKHQAAVLAELHGCSSREQLLRADLESARREADHDILTGLYNRRGWGRVIEQEEARSKRYGNPCTLVVVDLDELKPLNDSQGHRAGDKLIRRAAHAIRSTIRQPDIVARVGGDEFAILLVETDQQNAAGFLNRLEQALEEARIQASVGLAEWNRQESLCDTLYRADQAMYEDKRTRRRERTG